MANIENEPQEVVKSNTPASADDVLRILLSAEQVVSDTVYMKRFNVEFSIEAIDGNLIDRLQERCTNYIGKGNKRTKEVDEQKFGALIIQHGCKIPNWGATELLKKYNTQDPIDVIKNRLLAGEIQKLSGAILELSGYDDEAEDVKN